MYSYRADCISSFGHIWLRSLLDRHKVHNYITEDPNVPWVPDSPKKEIETLSTSFLGESGTQGNPNDTEQNNFPPSLVQKFKLSRRGILFVK